MTNTNYWQRANHGPALSLDECKSILGADHVALVMQQGKSYALCRATGMWDANEGAYYAAYKTLAGMCSNG